MPHPSMGNGGNASGMDNASDSPYVLEQDDDSGEGEVPSQFGRAKKPKRKTAPRTSRACLACRRQKMRCEGAENPPCRRCIANEVDCMFERRSDYLLNPEDRAWQNGVEKRLEHLSRTIDMILAHLGGQPPMPGPPNTAGPAFPEMPVAANGQYYESYERHGMPPNTAPPGTAGGPHAMGGDPNIGQSGMLNGPGRVQYVVPSAAETAAIAAQARMKRQRGNTLPNLPSAGFPPETAGFQLFSPRTGALDGAGISHPYSYGAPTPGPPSTAHPHHSQHSHQQQHPSELGGQLHHHSNLHPHQQYAQTPAHTYSFDAYSTGPGAGSVAAELGLPPAGGHSGPGSHAGSFSIEHDPRDDPNQTQQQGEAATHNGGVGAEVIPRTLSSPDVRFTHGQSQARDDIHGELGVPPMHSTETTA
ncbi:hypothetical protein P389DRAFT_167662 [Cystobasidium minutum MCA 4210]|uniref:uncharacterized protein n=1 Tax=Cystobasidium minutum MCA 4210 TaxID=1397322 RepID=UPI0034CFB8DE|eukprot:jgi/Rhomi1/167662/fgenesh1_kg.2_\